MLGIKKQFIKNMLKPEIVSNAPGKLQVYVAQIKKVQEEYRIYEIYAENALLLLKGVKNLQVDYNKGLATIKYDPGSVSVQKVYKWLQVLIDTGIDHYDSVKDEWENQPDMEESIKVEIMWQKMKPVLQQALGRLGNF